MIIGDELFHIGTKRHSGRYPWGSGENPYQRSKSLLAYVADLKKKGLTEAEIAVGMGIASESKFSTTELRALKSIAKQQIRAEDQNTARKLKAKNMSTSAIGRQMGLNESSVRDLLSESAKDKNDILQIVAQKLREEVSPTRYLDVGLGTENHMGISKEKLKTAITILKQEGYRVEYVKTQQQGTGKFTTIQVLVPPKTPYTEILKNQDRISIVSTYSPDKGRNFESNVPLPPMNINSKRVQVRYGAEGGGDMDGVIEIRRGVKDLDMGEARYVQARVAVDGTHYLKGMVMFADDLPKGVDVRFNTNKEDTGNKLDAMKKQKRLFVEGDEPSKPTGEVDQGNPFGTIIRQIKDPNDETKVTSAINIVNEEGDWFKWGKSLSSQVLSKQSPALAKQQLDLKYKIKSEDFDEIMALTNPSVRQKLLESFADDMDSSAVHLKAAALPRLASHVILPIEGMKDTEVYAPNYKNGERVVLIRHPHGGIFEIPEVTVNNRHPRAKSLIGNAVDAIGISPAVAKQLSGADFDGDTVLVIPNPASGTNRIKVAKPLAELKNFDPQADYKGYPGMPVMSARTKQHEMGNISNLITDMTVKMANPAEIARAVKHSMVIIDAEKHELNWRQSAKDQGISALKEKYQGRYNGGASTLISRSGSEERIPERKPRRAALGGPIDPRTGKKMYELTGENYTTTKTNKRTGEVTEDVVFRQERTTKGALADDAFKLSSGTPIEAVYAEHANKLKSLANQARKAAYETKTIPYSKSARLVYKPQVDSLNASLNLALQNKPLERKAQLLSKAAVQAKMQAYPDLDKDQIKKLKGLELTKARARIGAQKPDIQISPLEWEAIQAGAISKSKLSNILNNTNVDLIKKLATPRTALTLSPGKLALARTLLSNGYTQAEVASQIGVSASALNKALRA